ncbi:MAG: acetamidase/formamidase family protein [Nitrososphaerota archaeon]|nr:acetamidase/formamidase family protein [Nitrososphaerota archaeon]MDG6953156.1 acetamidase/formamidase family protein [Nitrososphaerota archaeon]MDG6956507.1 acetamidase/formamidase family protein [Nitrososphaerota archaeon]MDG6957297.1 acetamidase/formamidase family protein [Nitrososphaerota archaeon]MDG6960083.1 acetamidase/formamidase family protein [Nitrososphaerota archaeon]
MGNQRIGRESFHYLWSREHKPVISIEPGDDVSFDINDVSSWQVTKDTPPERPGFDPSKLYPLSGPVYVVGAAPGDTLVVDVLEVASGDFGWSAIIPGEGLLEEFQRPYLYKWDLGRKDFAPFEKGIRIPLRPFCGVMGVAPGEPGGHAVMPPGRHGGNLDIKHLTAGSRLELPVMVEGALFSTGDLHAAMGDGEVCVSAIECAGEARFRFDVVKGTGLSSPRYSTKGEQPPKKGYYVTTGIAPDLMAASKEAVRGMIEHLTERYGLAKEEAYVLCSVAVDLRIHEVVDQPNWVVGAMIPLDIFP